MGAPSLSWASQSRMAVVSAIRRRRWKEEGWYLGQKRKTFPNSWHLCPSVSTTLNLELETLHLPVVSDIGQCTECPFLSSLVVVWGCE